MMEKEFFNIDELIKNNLHIKEPENAANLANKSKEIFSRKYFTKNEFLEISLWKSPRPRRHYLNNSEEEIIKISRVVLSSKSEEEKMNNLISLKGVSVPVGSAILTMIDPINYGVIDIRVWQLLYLYGEVKNKSGGKGFDTKDWLNYLKVLRKYAEKYKIRARDIEMILFFSHKRIQVGNLY